MQPTYADFVIARERYLAEKANEKPAPFWQRSLFKIILIDAFGLALFAALVMWPDAIGGIVIVGGGLAFIAFIANGVAARWTWKDTAIVASPLIFDALHRAGRERR